MSAVADAMELRVNLADSAIAAALKRGDVASDLVRMRFCGPKVAHDGFKPMIRDGAFDAGELAIVTLMQAKCYGKPFTALPAVMVGRFQHHCIGYNVREGDLAPKDLEGRKVAVRAYSQTTGVWVRGILQHQFGVDLSKVTFAAHDDPHVAEAADPSFVERFQLDGGTLGQMLLDGKFAAAILGNDMPKDPRVKPLIPNSEEAARDWWKQTGVVQSNHIFVVHSDIARTRPDIVREIYRMLVESKKAAGLPKDSIDHLPFGFEAVRKSLDVAIEYAYEQGLLPRRLNPEELFDETTLSLT